MFSGNIMEDNQSAIKIANSPENNRRVKHLEIKSCFIKEQINNNVVKITYVRSEEQIADIFTKGLPS